MKRRSTKLSLIVILPESLSLETSPHISLPRLDRGDEIIFVGSRETLARLKFDLPFQTKRIQTIWPVNLAKQLNQGIAAAEGTGLVFFTDLPGQWSDGGKIAMNRLRKKPRNSFEVIRSPESTSRAVIALSRDILDSVGSFDEMAGNRFFLNDFLRKVGRNPTSEPGVAATSGATSISLCMIAKNEEEFLAQCLDSVEGLVDEIILVDAGSEDRTVDIARRYGARVFHRPWDGSFANARNAALREARGKWILVLDADEAIYPGQQESIRGLAEKAEIRWYYFKTASFESESCSNAVENLNLRLFPNSGAYVYRRDIHESLEAEGEKPPAAVLAGTRVAHYGYLRRVFSAKKKYQRNIDAILAALEQDPEDHFQQFNLASTYYAAEQFDKAVEAYERFQAICPDHQMLSAYTLKAISLLCLGNAARAVETIEQLLAITTRFPDAYFILGSAYYRLGRLDEAETALKKAIETPLDYTLLNRTSSDPENRGSRPLALLGQIAIQRGNPALGEDYLLRALDINPTNLETSHLLADGVYVPRGEKAYEAGSVAEALGWFDRAFSRHPRSYRALTGRAACYLAAGNIERALRDLETAAGLKPDFGVTQRLLGDVHYLLGNAEAALDHYHRALEFNAADVRSLLRGGELALRLGAPDVAAIAYGLALEREPDNVDAARGLALSEAAASIEVIKKKLQEADNHQDSIQGEEFCSKKPQ